MEVQPSHPPPPADVENSCWRFLPVSTPGRSSGVCGEDSESCATLRYWSSPCSWIFFGTTLISLGGPFLVRNLVLVLAEVQTGRGAWVQWAGVKMSSSCFQRIQLGQPEESYPTDLT